MARQPRKFEVDAAGRAFTYREVAGGFVRERTRAKPRPGDEVLRITPRGEVRAERIGPRGGRQRVEPTAAMRRAAARLEGAPPAPPPPPPPPAPERAPRRAERPAAPRGEPRAEEAPRPRAVLPPQGSRRFEVDERSGRTYTYRLSADRRWVRTLARGARPGPGDQVLTVTDAGARAEVVGPRGRRVEVEPTPAMQRAAEQIRAGAGRVVDFAGTTPGSRRARAIESELRAGAEGGPSLPSARGTRRRTLTPENVAALEARAAAGDREAARELARARSSTLFEDLGVSEADLASRERGTRGIREVSDLVIGRLAQPVARGQFSVQDVFNESGRAGLLEALEGTPGGLLGRLDPSRAYRVRVTVTATAYSGRSQTFTTVAPDGSPAILGGMIAYAICAELGPAGWLLSAGRAQGVPGEEEVDVLDVDVEVYEIA